MMIQDLQKRVVGKEILQGSNLLNEIHEVKQNNEQLIVELNTKYHSKKEITKCLSEITGKPVDSSVEVSLPFYSDFGKHITFGKNIFINLNVTFVDLGGIMIEDNVLIGPGARLVTVNHLVSPKKRRGLRVAPICVKQNAWIGANATILSGVTIGENAIVAADATVTKDVPANVVVAGSPAKQIRKIIEE
ncbi:acetyltransferase [Listeria monocytogenes]|uniref:DapH/DapD/GlmU-related protein n=1 Tax=Listeria monocytogenes TaxID=1639 RepID=UPI0004F3DA13|nr:DapH/DapD/GlmU-related protein [Listeria monocytogenes]EAC6873201.1 sugar O-acetyltransferase [Listeria monocytogenes]EAD1932290.1 sugar O-acetyltransferase [Listeria monocytogenes]EAE5921395.1 sugar O-acetyltransferase [Listeria monocytogenes]EAF5831693.1 sugar O-acetyltransferase [Listeria monocytogenes]EAG6687028.1 sugar O-acetyltransferase [Listeria monocytogenes]